MNKGSLKFFIILIFTVVVLVTVGICVIKPKMHKPFSFNIIEYLIKFNSDGSVSTTKQTTSTTLRSNQ